MNPLDPLDAAMMTGEVLSNPLHVAAVLILSPPEDAGPGYVDAVHQRALAATDPLDPRLCRYPHRGVDTGGIWVWHQADSVDLSHHCQRRTLPAGAGRDEFWRLISELHAERLDRNRPMWMSYLVDGLEDGRFAFYVKVHHTVMDGVAGFAMIAEALTTDSTRRSMPGFYAAHRREQAPARAANPFHLLRSLLGATASGVSLLDRAVEAEISDILGSVRSDTTMSPLSAPYTPFNGRLGRTRTVTGGSWPKARIQALQQAAEVTGNDVVIAVVSGVLRSWLLSHSRLPRRSLVAFCPITVRSREPDHDDGRGNMFGGWLCPLGTNLADPAERLDLIHRSMSEGKRQVANRGAGASMLLLGLSIAGTVLLPMMPLSPKVRSGYNVPISNVPGPRSTMYWNGSRVDEIYPVSAVFDGQALNVTICSYADRVGFGYVAGADVMRDIGTVVPLTERSFAELEEAVGVAHVQ